MPGSFHPAGQHQPSQPSVQQEGWPCDRGWRLKGLFVRRGRTADSTFVISSTKSRLSPPLMGPQVSLARHSGEASLLPAWHTLTLHRQHAACQPIATSRAACHMHCCSAEAHFLHAACCSLQTAASSPARCFAHTVLLFNSGPLLPGLLSLLRLQLCTPGGHKLAATCPPAGLPLLSYELEQGTLAILLPGLPASACQALRGPISRQFRQQTDQNEARAAPPACCLPLPLLRLQLLLLPPPRPHLCVAHLPRSPARLQNRSTLATA